jgi:hypothetical protein
MSKSAKKASKITVVIDESDKLTKRLAEVISNTNLTTEKVGRTLADVARQRAKLLSERALKEAR